MTRTSVIRTAGSIAAVSALALVAGCGGDSGNDGGDGGDGDFSGTITVGFAGEAPYSFEDGGELTGATVALHREIFTELGFDDLEGVNADFGALIPGLNAERFDVVSAGMSILPDRCEQAAFSDPEFMYTTALMVPEGNPENLATLDDTVGTDLNVATMTGAIETDYAGDLGISNHTEVATPQDGMDAVTTGRADVFALTGISLNWMAENSPEAGVEVTESFVQEIDGVPQVGAGATVFRTDDSELLEAYNEKLDEIVADEDRYLGIVGDYGFTEAERPDDSVSTEMLCAGDLPTGDEDAGDSDDE